MKLKRQWNNFLISHSWKIYCNIYCDFRCHPIVRSRPLTNAGTTPWMESWVRNGALLLCYKGQGRGHQCLVGVGVYIRIIITLTYQTFLSMALNKFAWFKTFMFISLGRNALVHARINEYVGSRVSACVRACARVLECVLCPHVCFSLHINSDYVC